MFDFDGAKLLIIGIVMLIVIKPKDLPGVMRQVGRAVAQMRRMANEFQGQFHEAMREAELHDLKTEVESMAKVDLDGLDPFDAMRGELASTKADIEAGLNARPVPALDAGSGDPHAIAASEPHGNVIAPPAATPAGTQS